MKQHIWFLYQLDLAWKLKLPVILHVREAHEDALRILRWHPARKLGGVIHCFYGSYEIAKQYLALGYHIGVVGRSYGKVTDCKSKWNGGGRKGYLTGCNHMYRLKLKNPDAKEIKVVAQDTNGNVYEQTRFTESFDYSECELTNKLMLTPRTELDKTY
jgi:hypothetical protein